ncbi:GTP cyclohydrolase [Dyadobacter sp. CY312]|uniref:GTP cyclohydrolase n=1 Tax=Dyadobacter sp. CY312 TaxID=2907303 RepID=UPI001F2F0326|nr:GTP cyclohydrolase [Dyadobacter sp. CY312]MCE7043895.1 GTP cyclohydrolase [Dyadobacter sp. CY312]
MIIKLAEGNLKTKFGEFKEIMYYDGQTESFALVMGDVKDEEDVLCRVHSSCIFAHHFNSIECDCREQMEISQQLIQEQGKGIVIWLDQEGKANGHFALLKSKEFKKAGMTQDEAYEAVGFQKDARDFTKAADIIKDLGVGSIRMLTNNIKKTATLTQYGIKVTGVKAITIEPGDNEELRKSLEEKKGNGYGV